jgi:hypothetical protein
VTTNTTFWDFSDGCDGTNTLLGFPTDPLKDFLAAFLYIEVHRSLGLVHQGTIPDLVLRHRVFLWLLYNSSLEVSRFAVYSGSSKFVIPQRSRDFNIY